MSTRLSRQQIIQQLKAVAFVGRQRQLELFRSNLDRTPGVGFHFIFNVFGQGGVGKTTLLEQYRALAADRKAFAIYFDVRPNPGEPAKDVPQLLGDFAAQLKEQNAPLDKLEKHYKLYRQQKQQLENDPEAPKGFFALLGKTAARIGLHEAKKIPVAGSLAELIDSDAVGEQLGEWASFVKKKLGNKDEVRLVLEPEEVLTPLLVEGLANLEADRQIILFVDNYEAADKSTDAWLRRLLDEPELPPHFVLVVAGREPLAPNDWSGWSAITQPVSLEPFTEEEAKDYLTRRFVTDPAVVTDILHLSGRLPVLMAFLSEVAPGELDSSDTSGIAVERFLKWVDDPARRSLALHAALPRFLNRDVLAALSSDADAATHFDWLLKMPFTQKRGDAWAYHPVVREMMMRHVRERSPKEFAELHLRLAGYFSKLRDELELPADKTWGDEDWVKWELESLLHRLVASPKKCLAEGVSGFVEAIMKRGNRFAMQWGETFQQAGACAKDETLRGWGLQMCRAMEEVEAKKYDLAGTLFTAILDQRLVEKADVRSFCWHVKGEIFEEKGEHNAAIEFLGKAVEIKPDYHEAWNNMGAAFGKKGEPDAAIESFRKAVEIKPDFHEAWCNMGYAFYKKGEHDVAIESYRKAVEIKPDYHEAWYNMGYAFDEKGEYDAAIESFRKAVEIKPDFHEAWCNMGYAFDEKGEYDAAIESFRKAVEIKPDFHEAWYNMGIAVGEKGEPDAAIESFRKAVEIKPDDHDAWYWMADAWGKKGDYDQAIKCYRKAKEIKPDYHEAWYWMGRAFGEKGEHDAAIESYRKAVEIKPDFHEAWYNMGIAFGEKGEHDAAIESFRKAVEIKPDDHKTWGSIGWNCIITGKLQEAKEALEECRKYSEDKHTTAPMNLGHVHLALGDREAALACYCRSLELFKDKAEFFQGMEDDWQHLVQYGISREAYDEVLAALRAAGEEGAEASES